MNNHSTRTLDLLCAKTRSKKHQIFQKWENFENRPSCMGNSPCEGSRFFEMISLSEKLKVPKTCKNPFYKNIRVVLCKKPHRKTQILEKCYNFEIQPSCKGYSPCMGYSLCKMVSLTQKLKKPKRCQKPLYKNNRALLCKSGSKKHQIFEE